MTQLEGHLEGIINIFHQYSIQGEHCDKLSKGELKELMSKELANTIKNTKDQATVDKIFQDLDQDRDEQVTFPEFVSLVVTVLETTHENQHKE